jgi:hypothetical protein
VTPEEAFRVLRVAATMRSSQYTPWLINSAADTLEQFILALEPDERRRALARAAQRSQANT